MRVIGLLLLVWLLSVSEQPYYVYEKEYTLPPIQKIIHIKAEQYEVDEVLMYAIIDLESNWNNNMSNPKSTSKQLAGFIKSTNLWVAQDLLGYEIEHGNVTVTLQIEILARYLQYLKHKYKNNTKLMMREYCNEVGYYEALMKRYNKYKNKNERDKVIVKWND